MNCQALFQVMSTDEREGMPQNEVPHPQLNGLYPLGRVQLTAISTPEHVLTARLRPSHLTRTVVSPLMSSLELTIVTPLI